MSCDFGVWFPHERLSNEEACKLYIKLCQGDVSGVHPHPAVDAFYAELTALHPEIDTIPEERLDDHDYCPWSCALDRSPAHVIMPCVFSQGLHVERLVKDLARKHGLAVFDPQSGVIGYPDDPPPQQTKRPWWRPW
jgi:hypothetical protein